MTIPDFTDRIIAQGKALVCAIEALGTIEPTGPFERAAAWRLAADWERRGWLIKDRDVGNKRRITPELEALAYKLQTPGGAYRNISGISRAVGVGPTAPLAQKGETDDEQ